jgi:hypothetical protein
MARGIDGLRLVADFTHAAHGGAIPGFMGTNIEFFVVPSRADFTPKKRPPNAVERFTPWDRKPSRWPIIIALAIVLAFAFSLFINLH